MKYIVQNSSSTYQTVIEEVINQNKDKIFDFFEHDEIDLPFNVYIYDSIESLVEGLHKRGFSKEPDYMCACFKDEDCSLNFFEPKDKPNENEWSKDDYKKVIFHELVHGIQFLIYGYTPEWINEGIAKYLDGTYQKGIPWLMENYIKNQPVPDQKEIEEEFGRRDYDSYDYAYIMLCYLMECYGKKYLFSLLEDSEKLKKASHNLLNTAIDYYNHKYFEKENQTKTR